MKQRHEYSTRTVDTRQLEFNFAPQKLLIGLGHKLRQGKDETARTIIRERSHMHKIVSINFADGLRAKANAWMRQISESQGVTYKEALEIMCFQLGVPYDRHAVADDVYKWGKQRAMLQEIGQGERERDPDYWVKQWKAAVEASDADIVLITDLRHPNELAIIKELDGHTIKVSRPGYIADPVAAAHISETALDGATFDHNIVNNSDLPALQATAIQLFDHIISQKESL